MNFKKYMVLFAAILMLTTMAFAQTAEEIIAKYVKVTGGEAKYKAIQTSYSEGIFYIPAVDIQMDLKLYSKRPGKMKVELLDTAGGMSVINSVNGDNGWMVDSFQGIFEPTEMDENTYNNNALEADFDGFLFDQKINGYKLEYVGIEDRAGLKVYNVKITNKYDIITNAYFDVDSGLLLCTTVAAESAGQSALTETRLADYKEVNGMLVAHTITIVTQGMEMTMTINKVVQNQPIDDSVFAMPKSE